MEYQIVNTLVNGEMYGPFEPIAREDEFTLYVESITAENWSSYFNGLLAILQDGIYTERCQNYFVHVIFSTGDDCMLSLIDLWFNLIMWSLLIFGEVKIMPYHIFFQDELKADDIKEYIDKFFINVNRSRFGNRKLNNIIADMLECYHKVDIFAEFLCNTLSLEDTAELMMEDREFYDCMHASFAGIPMDEVKNVGMEYANKSIERIKKAKDILGHDHCLADAWRASEGINAKQYKEFTVNIGTKPDGHGGIFPAIVDHSFINGGVTDPLSYFIESSTGRTAQIIKFNNVSSSGTFARILGLNNMDSFFYNDTEYDCHTKHLLPVQVKSDKMLKHLNLMYYRMNPNGIEKCINYWEDKWLIGKTIWLRSPITCASNAHGKGVCWKCYGNLAYSVMNVDEGIGINIGRIAAEIVTSKLTQMQLSVKHLLEAIIDKIIWCSEFHDYMEINTNVIQISSDMEELKDYKLLISPDAIEMESDDVADVADGDEVAAAMNYNEYITDFYILKSSTGEMVHITNDREENLYITQELNAVIRRKAEPTDDEMISIGFNELRDIPLFVMVLQNNEITKTLKKLKKLYNKADSIRGKTLAQLFQEILDTNIEGGLGISAVHYAILLMNQLRSADNIFEFPDWWSNEPNYRILTLNEALNMNPSITISLSYQKITPMFYAPLTYKKHGASFMDLFFMKRPQLAIKGIEEQPIKPVHKPGEIWNPIVFSEDPNQITVNNPIDDDIGMDEEQ